MGQPQQPGLTDHNRYETMYRNSDSSHGLPAATPWDIGGPQQAIQQLVAVGAINGEVLDPGTGPGHHAIHFASNGYSATGIDCSPSAIDRARDNARKAGVSVDFQVADATKLDGFEGRFDTVVDSAFYHVFSELTDLKRSYARALHRATKPGARLYMFEFAPGSVNGIGAPRSLSEDDFRLVFPDAGWDITYLAPATYQVNMSEPAFEQMLARNPERAEEIKFEILKFQLIKSWLPGGRAYAPVWEMHATRLD